MSYNRFTNLGELLQIYLASKLSKGLKQKEFVDRDYNFNSNLTKNINDICAYKVGCCKCSVFFKVT